MKTDILAEQDHLWENGHLMVDLFIDHATVRSCVDCGALIAGGPSRCVYCAKALDQQERESDLKERLKTELRRLIDEESDKIHPLFCVTLGSSSLSKKVRQAKLMMMRRTGKRDAYQRIMSLLDTL